MAPVPLPHREYRGVKIESDVKHPQPDKSSKNESLWMTKAPSTMANKTNNSVIIETCFQRGLKWDEGRQLQVLKFVIY